jgi:Protein of unknown function (DUF4197)
MKRITLPLLLLLTLIAACSCSGVNKLSVSQKDAAAGVREMLKLGVQESVNGTFTRESVMNSLFPEPLKNTFNTLQQLGISNELDRFSSTLALASEKAAERSIPVFMDAIDRLSYSDALQIIKNGGTSATDYLRSSAGRDLREAIRPVMRGALEEYHLNEQWEKIMKPAQIVAGNKLNLQLDNLMAGMVSEKMFEKIAEKEKEIRNNPQARTTYLLRKVFR